MPERTSDNMNIPLDDKTRITSDARNYIIERLMGHKKDGSERWEAKNFYTTIAGLFTALHNERIRKSACSSLHELGEAVKSSNEWLVTIAEQLGVAASVQKTS